MNNGCNASTGPKGPTASFRIPERTNRLLPKLLVLISVGIIGNVVYCLATTDIQTVRSIVHFHPWYLFGAALLSVGPWFMTSLRLVTWSRFLGRPVRYRHAFGIAMTADLGAAIAPPIIGGAAAKAGMLMHRGMDTGTALSLPVLENMEDTLFFVIMVPLALTLSSSWYLTRVDGIVTLPQFSLLQGAGLAALAALLLVLFVYGRRRARLLTIRQKVRGTTQTFLETFRRIGRRGKKVLILTMFLTATQWICRYSIISLLVASLGIPVQPLLFMVLQVFVFALTSLVPSPGGAGGAEFFFSILYNPFLSAGQVGLVTTGWRFFTFYFHTLLAALFSLAFGLLAAKKREMNGEQADVSADTTMSMLLETDAGVRDFQPAGLMEKKVNSHAIINVIKSSLTPLCQRGE